MLLWLCGTATSKVYLSVTPVYWLYCLYLRTLRDLCIKKVQLAGPYHLQRISCSHVHAATRALWKQGVQGVGPRHIIVANTHIYERLAAKLICHPTHSRDINSN